MQTDGQPEFSLEYAQLQKTLTALDAHIEALERFPG